MERSEAISLLHNDYHLFTATLDELEARTALPPIVDDASSPGAALLTRTAKTLREEGVAVCRNLFSDAALLENGRAYSRLVKERADLLDVGLEDKLDEELGGLMWRRLMARSNSRISFNAKQVPTIFLPLVENTFLPLVIALAAGVTDLVKPALLIVDNLQPTREHDFQWWHFDRLSDQYKAMVLLGPVDEGNGPMKIIPRSHRNERRSRILDFAFYAQADQYDGEIGYGLIDRMRKDIVLCTGEPGDVFLFNTRAFHCHGRPDVEPRLSSTLYYTHPVTPLNLFFSNFRQDNQIV